MRLTIMLWIVFQLCTNNIFAQRSDSIYNSLMLLEKKYYASNSNTDKTTIAFNKINIYIKNNLTADPECMDECNRVQANFLSDSDRIKYYWNAAMINLLQNNNTKSVEHINCYKKLTNDTSTACFLLEIMAKTNSPYDSVIEKDYPIGLQNLNTCLIAENESYGVKNNKYNWTSYIIPGAGMACKGYVSKGASALAVNGLSALFIYSLLKNNLYVNAFGYGMLTFFKFYQGNIVYTKKMVAKKIFKNKKIQMQNCHQYLEKLLMANPLNYKL